MRGRFASNFIVLLIVLFSTSSVYSQTVYTVQPGDTLSIIAKKFYGDGLKWHVIYDSNATYIKSPNAIYVGLKLIIPPIPSSKKKSITGPLNQPPASYPKSSPIKRVKKKSEPIKIPKTIESKERLLAQANAFSHQWKVTCEQDFPPYNYKDVSENMTGLDTELVTAVLGYLDIDFEINTYPWKRVVNSVDSNEVDFAFQFASKAERFEKYWMVGPLRSGITLFVVRKNSTLTNYNTLRDLIPYTIGHVMGYAYTDEFDAATYLTKEVIRDNELLVKILAKGRCDMIIGDLNTLSYFAKKNMLYDQIRFLPKILKEVPRYVAFPKERKAQAVLFAKGLKAIQENGKYERIMKKWR